MEEIRQETDESQFPVCAAVQLEQTIDWDTTHVFKNQSAEDERRVELGCLICESVVVATPTTGVVAVNCMVSQSCEGIWLKLHPQDYDARVPQSGVLPCAGSTCQAALLLKGQVAGPGFEGDCVVDVAGAYYREKSAELLNNMPLTDPNAGFEVFDGQQ